MSSRTPHKGLSNRVCNNMAAPPSQGARFCDEFISDSSVSMDGFKRGIFPELLPVAEKCGPRMAREIDAVLAKRPVKGPKAKAAKKAKRISAALASRSDRVDEADEAQEEGQEGTEIDNVKLSESSEEDASDKIEGEEEQEIALDES